MCGIMCEYNHNLMDCGVNPTETMGRQQMGNAFMAWKDCLAKNNLRILIVVKCFVKF